MRFTLALQGGTSRSTVEALAGLVDLNGQRMLPHEAAMLGDALIRCAEQAEDSAANTAAKLQPVTL